MQFKNPAEILSARLDTEQHARTLIFCHLGLLVQEEFYEGVLVT